VSGYLNLKMAVDRLITLVNPHEIQLFFLRSRSPFRSERYAPDGTALANPACPKDLQSDATVFCKQQQGEESPRPDSIQELRQ
jgi:hypothetical protein